MYKSYALYLQNNLLPNGEKRKTAKTLVIESVDRHEAGIYICEANNGVGVGHVKAEAKIKLQVLCEYFHSQGIDIYIYVSRREWRCIFWSSIRLDP